MQPLLKTIWRFQKEQFQNLAPQRPLQIRKPLPHELERLKQEGRVTQGLELRSLLKRPNERLKTLQKELWDNGLIAEWVTRHDTECVVFSSPLHTMFIWGRIGTARRHLADAQHCFRILEFLGAPAGFSVTWWAIPVDRVTRAGEFPTRAEVNGGWAYRARPAIWVFREEEWDRVVIHECIHALNWDVHPLNCLMLRLRNRLSL